MATTLDATRSRSAAGRNSSELAWERCQEQALSAFRRNEMKTACAGWARGLHIAERYFGRGDPRLATSHSNHGFALMRQERVPEANTMFRQAILAWEDGWRWIPLMTPSVRPGETEPAPYDHRTQQAFYNMIKKGQEMTEMIWHENRLPPPMADDWNAIKPQGMTDIRRLYSAILLMPTARPTKAA